MSWESLMDRVNVTIRNTFKAEAVHTPAVGEVSVHLCVHAYEWIEIDTGSGNVQSAQMHTAFIRILDLVTFPKQDDVYSIDGTDYVIIDVRRDGSGGAKLILHLGE